MKLYKRLFISLGGFVILAYLLMVIDTNSITLKVKNVMLGKTEDNGGDIYYPYFYDAANSLKKSGHNVSKINLSLVRLFVVHNFISKGCIGVFYTIEIKDNEKLLTASHDIFSIWKIKKIDGVWEIVDIVEAP
jgi:hypothetical protein